MRSTLYPFQERGVDLIEAGGFRAILGDEVGLGKTVQSLAAVDRYTRPSDPPGPVVVVCPSHLKINWRREVAKHLGGRVELLSGERAPPDKLPPVDPNQTYVLNYDILIPGGETTRAAGKAVRRPGWPARTQPPADSWTAWLGALRPRWLIADEAQMLGDPTSNRTRAVRWLARRAPKVLLLTATPMQNRPADLWTLLNIVRPATFNSRMEFCLEYTNARKRWWGWEFPGARNLDLLHHRLLAHRVLIWRRKADVLSELPVLTRAVVPVEVDLREYRRAETDFLGWLAAQDRAAADKAAKAERISRQMHLWRLVGRLKLTAVMDHVEAALDGTTDKLILGAMHRRVTYPLIEAYGGTGRAVLVDGDLTPAQKQDCFDRFNRDPRCRLLIGQMLAAGTGWSCTSTSEVMTAEFPWRPADLTQFFGRIDGLERGVPGVAARARMLMAEGTIDEDMCDVLNRKSRWAALAVDGGAGAADTAPIHDAVLAAMRGRRAAKGVTV